MDDNFYGKYGSYYLIRAFFIFSASYFIAKVFRFYELTHDNTGTVALILICVGIILWSIIKGVGEK